MSSLAAPTSLPSRVSGRTATSRACRFSRAHTTAVRASLQQGRRQALLGLVVGSTGALIISHPQPAAARTIIGESIAGVWKGIQRRNGGVKILAPIRVAEERLTEAAKLLESAASAGDMTDVLKAIRVSSLNCYAFEALQDDDFEVQASQLAERYRYITSADPCTFRIIVKNVTSLSSEQTKKDGQSLVNLITQSYNLLDLYLEQAITGNLGKLEEAKKQLSSTLALVQQLDMFVQKELAADPDMHQD